MLSPNARAGKERIFSTAVRPKIGKKVTLDENFDSGPPTYSQDSFSKISRAFFASRN
jgi:hypothetical protein